MSIEIIQLNIEEIGSGPTIILLHGFGVNLNSWQYIWPQLAKTHRVILVDLKGFGKSPIPRDGKYSILDQSNLIVDLIRQKKLRDITLIGHSMGGCVALFTALSLNKSDNQSHVSRLILLDSVAYPQKLPPFIQLLRTPFLGSLALSALPEEVQVNAILKTIFYDKKKISKELITAYASNLKRPNGKYALLKTAKQLIPANIEKFSNDYGSIKSSTLLIWGDHDKIVPIETGKKLNFSLPNSKLVVLNNCGHAPQEEKPAETYKIIKTFLDGRRE